MKKFRKIGVLTSGGDAAGMNAVIKAVANKAAELNMATVGIGGGYASLIHGDLVDVDRDKVYNIVGKGGTVLYSSRCPEFATEEGMQTAIKTCKENGIDALVCIGGDGTFRGATDMVKRGIPAIGIPGTIDNDVTASEYTIGYDSAVNETVKLIDDLAETAESHSRVMVVEAMGRHCGHIALQSAIAGGAMAVIVPEIPFDEKKIIDKLLDARAKGKRGMIVVVAEGVETPEGKPYADELTDKINKAGLEARLMRPAHAVRGCRATAKDRIIATEMGQKAVEMLVAGESNKVLCVQDGEVKSFDICTALVADRKYKNKLKPGDLESLNAEQTAVMEDMVKRKEKVTAEMGKIAEGILF